MPTFPLDLDAELDAILREDEEDPGVDVDAALADPLIAAVIARATKRYERVFSPKGMDLARRTLALHFATSPRGIAEIARLREAVKSGTATADGVSIPQGKTKP